MPHNATIAPTKNDTPNPLMNAARAARASNMPVAPPTAWATPRAPPSEPRMAWVTADRQVPAFKRSRHVILVPGRGHAADDRHAERPADLEGHGVGRRPDAGVALGNRAHDGVGRRRQQEPGPKADEQQTGQDVAIGRREGGGCRDLPQPARDRRQSGGDGELDPDEAGEERGQRGAHHEHGGHRQDAQSGLER